MLFPPTGKNFRQLQREHTRDRILASAVADSERLSWLIENFMHDDDLLGEKFVREDQARGLMRAGSSLHLLHLISGALTYNLLVVPQTLKATATDLASAESIAMQVEL